MRVAIIGRTEILYKTAELLKSQGFEIALIITSKEAPEYKVTAADFEKLAKEWNVPFLLTQKITNSHQLIASLKPIDIAVSLNFTGVVPQETIDLFKLGVLNAHGGDLPKYRGNACQAWAIINGEDRIGLCIHRMIGGELDSGDILDRKYFDLSLNTKVGEVLDWIEEVCPSMFLYSLGKLKNDPTYVLEVQSKDPKDALRCYPRMPEDGRIDWTRSNIQILRLINASNKPFTGAFSFLADQPMIIWDANLGASENFLAIPGQITKIQDGSVEVATGEGKLLITSIEYQGQLITPDKIIKSIRTRLK